MHDKIFANESGWQNWRNFLLAKISRLPMMVPGLSSGEGSGGVGLDGCGLGAVVSPISLQRLLTSVM